MIILKKFEYDDDYDFDDEGEEEAMFQEYRKTIKMLFSSIAKMVSCKKNLNLHQKKSSNEQRKMDFLLFYEKKFFFVTVLFN